MLSFADGSAPVLSPEIREKLSGIRMAAFDLDDTLISGANVVSERNRKALELLKAQGICVVMATGRDIAQLSEELKSPFDYSVSANGALTQKGWDEEAERISVHPLSLAQIRACLRVIRRGHGAGFLFRFGEQAGTQISVLRFLKLHGKALREADSRLYRSRLLIRPFLSKRILLSRCCGKIQGFFRTEERMNEAKRILRQRGDLEVLTIYGTELELTARGVTKAAALCELSGILGFGPEQIIAFGDSRNDLEMLKACGLSVAMANGDPKVIAAADLVAPEARADGVAVVIESLFQGSSGNEK